MTLKQLIAAKMKTPDPESLLWLIWSHEHKAWWKTGRHGYTPWSVEAGRYSWAEAIEIVTDANRYAAHEPNEAMVPEIFKP